MKNLLYVLSIFAFVSCSDENDSSLNQDSTKEAETDTADVTLEIEEGTPWDPEAYFANREIEFPKATVDDEDFPYPNAEFLAAFEKGKLPDLGYYSILYDYVVWHFDSLESKQFLTREDSWSEDAYDFKQNFSGGITYAEMFYGEGGASTTVYTSCDNKEAIYSTLNALANYKIIGDEWSPPGYWNDKKTAYEPEEGVGCYYNIVLDDSTEHYRIDNYCGC